jgi:hypothetical protein
VLSALQAAANESKAPPNWAAASFSNYTEDVKFYSSRRRVYLDVTNNLKVDTKYNGN